MTDQFITDNFGFISQVKNIQQIFYFELNLKSHEFGFDLNLNSDHVQRFPLNILKKKQTIKDNDSQKADHNQTSN